MAEADRPQSFEEFYERERDRVFGALCLITGNRHEAEEITQDAFLALWERWERVREMEDSSGYLFRTAINGFRKRRRRAAVALRRAVGLSAPADELDSARARSELMAALRTLSDRQRAALVVTELLGYGSEEAGAMLRIKGVTVRVLASQARAALRRTLEAGDG